MISLALLQILLLIIVLAGSTSILHATDVKMPGISATPSNAGPTTSATVTLSPEEKSYLAKLGAITICPDPDWVPYEFMDSQGNYTGIAADLLELIATRLGIKFTYI